MTRFIRCGMKSLIGAILIIFLAGSQSSKAAEFRVERYCPQCDDSLKVYLIGDIVIGDSRRLTEILRSHGPKVQSIELRSGGGNVQEATAIGRLIRSLYLDTNAPIGRDWDPRHDGCRKESKQFSTRVACGCASACFLVFVAGVGRNGTELFLHRISFPKEFFGGLSPSEAEKKYQEGLEAVRSYLSEMGVPDKYYYKMLRTSSGRLEKLTRDEVYDFSEIPAFSEWLTAQCGEFTSSRSYAMTKKIAACRQSKAAKARQDAFRQVLGVD